MKTYQKDNVNLTVQTYCENAVRIRYGMTDELNSRIKEAKAQISGLGLFELYINGKKANDSELEK